MLPCVAFKIQFLGINSGPYAEHALYQPSYCPRQPRKVLETEQSKLFQGSMKEKEIRKEVIR